MAIPAERCGAVILCGGQSRRMGTCKALLTVDGVPVLHRLAGSCPFLKSGSSPPMTPLWARAFPGRWWRTAFRAWTRGGPACGAAGIKKGRAFVRSLRPARFFGAGGPVLAVPFPAGLRRHGVPGRSGAAPPSVRDLYPADAAGAGTASGRGPLPDDGAFGGCAHGGAGYGGAAAGTTCFSI